MERRRIGVLLSATLVLGVLIGATIAYTLLAESATMTYNVKATTPLEWDKLGAPNPPLYRGVWYNTTVIDFNLTNNDVGMDYKIKNFMVFNHTSENVFSSDVKAAYKYHKDGGGWSGWINMEFTNGYDTKYFAMGEFGTGITLAPYGDTGCWVEFLIRFWIDDNAPTGVWKITLYAYDFYDYP
jgi:hypothetical protein